MQSREKQDVDSDLIWRIVGLVNIYRLLAALVLLGVHLLTQPTPAFGAVLPRLFVQLCIAYLSLGALLAVAGQRYWPNLRMLVLVHTLVDTAAISLLLYSSGGVTSNLAVLLVLPVGGMVLLAKGREPLLVAALATLGVLGQQIMAQVANLAPAADYPQAGVTGAVIFAVAAFVWPVANRLRESEALVKRQELDLANLAQLSQYIVQNLRESMLVVDPSDRIRLINGSAAQALGDAMAVPGALLGEVSAPLLYRLATWRRSPGEASMANDPSGPFATADGSGLVEPHFAPLGTAEPAPVLIFLEDTGALAAKVQQSKLAALGRLSASIAHEIRNPIGAMSHAAQLLDESPQLDGDERRLTEIMRSNAARVSSIVENVLGLSRRAAPRPEMLHVVQWCQRFAAEFCATMQCPPDRLMLGHEVSDLEILMDAGHLHQIVWNLCENALIHGGAVSGAPVELRSGRMPLNSRPFLEVADRGPGISAPDTERIFEPFFTQRSQGTGLGLFLARELAEINDGTLLYRARDGGGSVFRIVFADPKRWQAADTLTARRRY
jgi:two-component system sensor histidine kinase PilS (NtrC family)